MCQNNLTNITGNGTSGGIGGDCPAITSCHDWEYYPCGCSKCRRCGMINRCYQNNWQYQTYPATVPYPYQTQVWSNGTTLTQQCINNAQCQN